MQTTRDRVWRRIAQKNVQKYEETMTEEQIAFLKGQDFLKLGHNISSGQWNLAMSCVKRMQKQCRELELEGFDRLLAGIQSACRSNNKQEALQLMTQITARRVQLRNRITQEAVKESEC